MAAQWLQLTPLDVVTVRDGRPFGAGSDWWAEMASPSPATVAGSVHQATKQFGGFMRLAAGLVTVGGHVLAPWPEALVVDSGAGPDQLRWLRPTDADPGSLFGRSDMSDSMAEFRLLHGDGKRPDCRWIRLADLARFMSGELSEMVLHNNQHIVNAPAPFTAERHVGIYRNGQKTEDGYLYSLDCMRPEPSTQILARVTPRKGLPPDMREVVPFGGEDGWVEVTIRPSNKLGISRTDHYPDGKVVVYLAAPAVFKNGWYPDVPNGARLVGAAVRGPEPIAAWATGSTRDKPRFVLRHGAPAGSVYWFEFDGPDREQVAGSWARSLHANALPQSEPLLRSQGFGWCFTSSWT